MASTVTARPFGETPDGRLVRLWTMHDADRGVTVSVMEWGACIQSVRAPDRSGVSSEIALGFPRLADYLRDEYRRHNPYFGATIGRYANRIAQSRFSLDGVEYRPQANEGPHLLHGGAEGFDGRLWSATPLDDGVRLEYTSPAGEGGFPGTVRVTVEFTLIDGDLTLETRAESDARTVLNPTNHSYWNLAGDEAESAAGHLLRIDADSYLPVDDQLIPIGTLEPVAGSPFDFRQLGPLDERLGQNHLQLERAGGIDHSYVLRPPQDAERLRPAVTIQHPGSGRTLKFATSEPAVQLYSGNALDGRFLGHGGRAYGRRSGIAVEPQHFPDSPNRPAFPSTVLGVGKRFTSSTRMRFCTFDD
ncbi:aldose epimerase family protein [Microbacterium sp. X-17]|uniref:aldose epimerase family protein n=1 Tax=Microbacterium sp. X-17 TaxID=3144404 RepID=UPI0031F50033